MMSYLHRAAAMFALLSMTVTHATIADILQFDNTAATFRWLPNGGSRPMTSFDPTRAPSEQASFSAVRALRYSASLGGSGTIVSTDFVVMGAQIRLAQSPLPTTVVGPAPGQQRDFLHAAVFQPGEQVGPAAIFPDPVSMNVGYFNVNLGRHGFLGQSPFLGFRVTLDDGLARYGWIEFDYRESPIGPDGDLGLVYQPIRWAYETEPNTPITVSPSPGSLGVIALAGLVAGRRRR